MKKKGFTFIFLCLSFLSLFGCGAEAPSSPRVVSSITVDWNRNGYHFSRHYTDAQKMEDILLYLRYAQTKEIPEADPEALPGSVYEITVVLMDGKKHIYRQQHHQFFRREQDPWQSISPELAIQLYALLRQNKSDL